MDCRQAKRLLSLHCAGALSKARRDSVEAHVADCAACRRELDALARTAALLSETPPLRPGRDLWPGVATQLAPRPARVAWWRPLTPARGLAVAALMLVVVLALVAAPHSPRDTTLVRGADEDAALYAHWHAQASATIGLADPYVVAWVVSTGPQPIEVSRDP